MNANLFNAILSMDAYSHGYDAAIELPGSDTQGTQLGNATISVNSSEAFNDNDQQIGFYALAYDIGGAGTIISYRGTDDVGGIPNPLTDKDVFHGWSLGAGNIDSEQGHMAIEFYKAVADGTDLQLAQISTTGHSLGGGLAGLVASNDNFKTERLAA